MGCEGDCGPGGKKRQPTAGFMTHVTCRLTAKNWDQLCSGTLRSVIEYGLPLPFYASVHQAAKMIGPSSPLKGCEGTAGLAESNSSLPPGL